MLSRRIGRRGFLLASCGMAGAVVATLDRAKPAQAFSLVEMDPGSKVGISFANRCSTAAQGHADILARLQTQLAAMSGAKGTTIYETAVCPICGCPITASRTIE